MVLPLMRIGSPCAYFSANRAITSCSERSSRTSTSSRLRSLAFRGTATASTSTRTWKCMLRRYQPPECGGSLLMRKDPWYSQQQRVVNSQGQRGGVEASSRGPGSRRRSAATARARRAEPQGEATAASARGRTRGRRWRAGSGGGARPHRQPGGLAPLSLPVAATLGAAEALYALIIADGP